MRQLLLGAILAVFGQAGNVCGFDNDADVKKPALEALETQLRRAVPTSRIKLILSPDNSVILTGTVARGEDVAIVLAMAQGIDGIQVINALRVGLVQQVQLDLMV